MRFQAVWLLSCGHERGFTRPDDEPIKGQDGACYLCPSIRLDSGFRTAPMRTYVRKIQ